MRRFVIRRPYSEDLKSVSRVMKPISNSACLLPCCGNFVPLASLVMAAELAHSSAFRLGLSLPKEASIN